jgi:hypothetical protein
MELSNLKPTRVAVHAHSRSRKSTRTEQDGFSPIKPSSTRGHECVYSATDEVPDSLYTEAKRVYRFTHCFRITFASLFSPLFFAHLRVSASGCRYVKMVG